MQWTGKGIVEDVRVESGRQYSPEPVMGFGELIQQDPG